MAVGLIGTTFAFAQSGPPQAPSLQAEIGKILNVQGAVTIERSALVAVQASFAGRNAPKPGDFVYRGDVVQTGADGKVDLVFSDGTAFNVLKNARIELNEFVYDPSSTTNTASLSVTKGTLTFVAGQIAKSGSMTLKTPVGTMGIRGTTPRVEIMDDGSVKFSTLVEEGHPGATPAPGGGAAPGVVPAAPRQRRAATPLSPQQNEAYDRFLQNRPRICKNC
jgi:hypothetical protein